MSGPTQEASRRSPAQTVMIALAVVAVFAVVAMIWYGASRPPLELRSAVPNAERDLEPDLAEPDLEFVGSQACAECHAPEYAAWQGSQHERAMQHATAATVLGDFANASFSHAGIESSFFVRDGRYFVRTDGADGELADFEIRYTYGVEPLQQYLVEFPDGRLQALTIAWDTRPQEQGGQRWFHLYPHELIRYDDELHWTQRQQNWNFMCADCHSTDIRKNYAPDSDTFATVWAELSVGCEACHGPGSVHVGWARSDARDQSTHDTMGLTVRFSAREHANWTIDPASGNAVRSGPEAGDEEIDVCAQCHSRRSQIAEGYHAGRPFLDHYLPALIDPPLYWVDGQQRDEVYIWGSYLQSKMYAQGVTCSDCHEPHTQRLRAPGNAVCAQCHLGSKYDTPQHHFHDPATAGSQCVDCHMPADDYMIVDPRRDHSLRVPRPADTLAYGVPNACNDCHVDESPEWAAGRVREWYGHAPSGFQQFAGALDAAERGRASAAANLVALLQDRMQPDIVRATAAHGLVEHPDPLIEPAVIRALNDPYPLVRRGALTALELFPPDARLTYGAPLLEDPLRVVRIEAAFVLASVPQAQMTETQRRAFEQAAQEFLTVQRYNADRPEALMLLASFRARQGDVVAAEGDFRRVLDQHPDYLAAYANLADLYRSVGRESDAQETLQAGLARQPRSAALHHALGLSLVRSNRLEQALPELARAAELDPDDGRFSYVHAVALHSGGKVREAVEVLEDALVRGPEDRDLLVAAVMFNRELGQLDEALRHARQLASVYPGDVGAQRLLAETEAAARP